MEHCFVPAEILLPAEDTDLGRWACVACDQFTGDEDYWKKVEEIAADSPSALNMIFPEIYLSKDNSERTEKKFALSIDIDKHIPEKAGLGGGSSDAAAVLLFLNKYFKSLNRDELILLSQSVGADVPFFVSEEKLARVNGIGEIVIPLIYDLPYKYITLFRAQGSGVSTKEAYEKLDDRNIMYSPLPPLSFPLKRDSFPNDFELLEGTDMLKTISSLSSDGDYASLSGSGSVWFVLSREQINTNIKEFIGSKEIM